MSPARSLRDRPDLLDSASAAHHSLVALAGERHPFVSCHADLDAGMAGAASPTGTRSAGATPTGAVVSRRSFTVVSLVVAFGTLPPILARPLSAQLLRVQTHPMEVTSDTPAYCLHLLDRVSELVRLASAPVPLEVTNLTTEGQRLCANGQTRSGITRLRSALMIMERNNGPAYR